MDQKISTEARGNRWMRGCINGVGVVPSPGAMQEWQGMGTVVDACNQERAPSGSGNRHLCRERQLGEGTMAKGAGNRHLCRQRQSGEGNVPRGGGGREWQAIGTSVGKCNRERATSHKGGSGTGREWAPS